MEAVLVAFLAPFLPHLLKVGGKVVDESVDAVAGEAGRRAKALWAKIFPKVEESPTALGAANRVAESPEDTRARGALELELQDLFKADGALKREVERMLEEARQAGVVASHGGVAVGGSVDADRGSIGVIGTVGGDVKLGGPGGSG